MSGLPAMTPFEMEAERRREVLAPSAKGRSADAPAHAHTAAHRPATTSARRGIFGLADAWLGRAVRRA